MINLYRKICPICKKSVIVLDGFVMCNHSKRIGKLHYSLRVISVYIYEEFCFKNFFICNVENKCRFFFGGNLVADLNYVFGKTLDLQKEATEIIVLL